MKPASFRYHAPKTIEQALALLAEYAPDDGRVLAGGQSLVPIMAFRLARPAHLVDINGVDALRRLAVDGERLCIGAGVRHATFHKPVIDGPLGWLLAAVVRHIAHYPIRTRGTFCGSIAHADPAAEWCLVAAALEAAMVARSAGGTRIIPAQDFFRGIMTTALNEDELLTEVRLPILPALAAAVDSERQAAAGRLTAARATRPGEVFTAGGQTLRRTVTTRAHAARVWAEDPAGGPRRNLTREEHQAFWAWAAVEVLRSTGIRIEELTELSHHSLIQYRLPGTGELIPLLQITPSKTDEERLLPVD